MHARVWRCLAWCFMACAAEASNSSSTASSLERRYVQKAARSCFGGATAAPNRTLEILVALAASLLAYGLASAIAIGVPTALLVATCTDVKGESVVRLGASVATVVALLSVLFARTHPRGVLVLAIIALAIMGAVGLERGRLQRS